MLLDYQASFEHRDILVQTGKIFSSISAHELMVAISGAHCTNTYEVKRETPRSPHSRVTDLTDGCIEKCP